MNSPRQAFQQAFTLGWITGEEVWVDILRARNTAIHVYRQEYAEALYRELPRYYTKRTLKFPHHHFNRTQMVRI